MGHTLLLLRHAKSSWKDTTLPDSERPLNKRGRSDAPRMGRRLKSRHYRCDRIIASPALRALATASAVAGEIGYEGEIIKEPELYMAGIGEFLKVIAGVEESVTDLMLVGHNPGMEEFLAYLTGERVETFPTAAYALLQIEGTWAEPSRVTLLRFDYPKSEAD